MPRPRILICVAALGAVAANGPECSTARVTISASDGTAIVDTAIPGGGIGSVVGAELRQACISDLTAKVTNNLPTGVRADAHIYLRDPNEIYNTVASLTDDDIIAGRWVDETAVPHGRPRVLVVPDPPASSYVGVDYNVPLGTTYWPAWDGTPSSAVISRHPEVHRCLSTTSPAGPSGPGDGVRAVFLYDRGLCRRPLELRQTVLDPAVNQIWRHFDDEVSPIATARRRYSVAISYVRKDQGDVLGGFFYAFHFVVNGETHLWGNYRYDFALDDSDIPTVRPLKIALHSTGGLAPLTEGRLGTALGADDGDLVKTLREGAAASLTVPPFFYQTVDCSPGMPVAPTCARAATDLAQSLRARAGQTWSADDLVHARCAVGDLNSCDQLSRDGSTILTQRWRCAPAATDPQQPVCQFVLPVKRMNPMPDAIDMVFFDKEGEVDNAAYAVAGLIGSSECQDPESVALIDPETGAEIPLPEAPFKVATREFAATPFVLDPFPF